VEARIDVSAAAGDGARTTGAISESAALLASGVVKRYGSVVALDQVGVSVASGELVGLVGANGAGKSTLVKIACGLVRPTSGTVTVYGTPAGSREARRQLGYLAELFRFPGWSTASEVLALHQQLAGSAGGETERHELLELVGLSDVARRRVEGMSKGMQQRLGIAQALVGEPKLLLLDEPLANLDVRNEAAMVEVIAEVARSRGITVMLVAHDLNPLIGVIDRVCYVAGGGVATGTPDEVVSGPVLSRLYGAPIEVLTDSRGRHFVVGLDSETAHPHAGGH